MTARHALLGAVLALPVALLVLAAAPGERLHALAAAAPLLAGLIVLDHVLRARATEGTAFWTLVLGVYATDLYPLLAHAPDARRALAFLAGALAVALLGRGAPAARVPFFAAALLAGAWLDGPWRLDGPGGAAGLFGSRDGLVFWTPLLWACLAGLVVLARREGRAAAPVVVVAILPLALAPFTTTRLDAAWPALLVALAVALESLCATVRRRPAIVLVAALPLLALSNLLFMEQYRYTLRRDDTVSFPLASEGNARLFARALGSPVAWPANWVWAGRNGLPVERWDLLSGQRLDPAAGVAIDVGDLEQDAAFLLDGWSVRHACGGDAVCREVEGRAEMVLPLRAPARAALRAAGEGTVRVTINGQDAGTVALGEPLAETALEVPLRAGINRVVLETGSRAMVDALLLREASR